MPRYRSIPGMSAKTGSREHSGYKTRNKSAGRQPRNRSGEGYNTNRSSSRYKFEVNVEFGKFDRTMAEAKREMKKLISTIEKDFLKSMKTKSKRTGFIRSYSEVKPGSDVSTFGSTIDSQLKSEKFTKSLYDNFATDVGKLGVANVRVGIQNPMKSPKKFRYETGTMYDSVDFKKSKSVSRISVSIGWNNRFYKYFDFQERGTRYVGEMGALTTGYRKTIPQAYRLMSRFMNNYTEKGGFSGRYTR